MLRDKLSAYRRARLDRFRRTGRAITLVPDVQPASIPSLYTAILDEDEPGTPGLSGGKKYLGDRLLFIFEVAALIVFLALLVNGTRLLGNLNQKASAAWVLPTLTPTPLIRAVVLPSGHTPPTSPGGTRPNVAEIPEHLRPIAQSWSNLPVPTAAPQNGIRIQIPAIGVDAPVIQGDGWEQLKKGVAQHPGTTDPGQSGNMVLSGHNDVFGEVFRDLDQLKPGDEIVLFTNQQSYPYLVTGWVLVQPTQVEVMDATRDATITLISCYPYLVDTQRIVVKARLVNS
jgi:sortase A